MMKHWRIVRNAAFCPQRPVCKEEGKIRKEFFRDLHVRGHGKVAAK
jgi:hypothetical protein